MTVAIYARLSPKPSGDYEGVDDQITWGRTYAEKAWPGEPVETYGEDRGKSAGRDDVRREGFERLRQDVRDGKVTRLWAVEQSRLSRREIEWFEFAAELDEAGISEVHTNRDGIVRVGDEVAGIKAVLAAAERRKTLRRLKDTLAEKAAKGEPPGVRPFGYVHALTPDGTKTYEVVQEQAEAIEFAAEKVLAGWSLASIAAALDTGTWADHGRGVRGAHGGKVTSGAVKGWLTAPSIAGQRVHSGEIVGSGNWPAILDLSTFKAVGARLNGARTVQRADGGSYPVGEAHRKAKPGRKYLLTGGLAICAECQAPLLGSIKQMRNKSKPYLLCHPNVGGKGCLGIMLPEVEAYVLERLWQHLDSPEFLDSIADDTEHEQERARLVAVLEGAEAQRREWTRMRLRGEITPGEWEAAREELAAQEAAANAALAVVPTSSARVDIAEAQEGWEEFTLDEKRAFVRRYVTRVTIHRATKHGRPGLDTDRVKIDPFD